MSEPASRKGVTVKKFEAFTWRPNGKAFTYAPAAWKAYWDDLNITEQNSLHDRAAQHGISLASAAIKYGAVDDEITKVTEPPT